MTHEERERKIRELELDHIAAGGFVSYEDAEKIIEQVYGPETPDGPTKSVKTLEKECPKKSKA